jgi:hypothetical protein
VCAAILSSGLFERVESLRYRGGQMRDVRLDSSLNEGSVEGPSVGVLLALSFMQLVTNCRFKPKVCAVYVGACVVCEALKVG